MSDSKSGFDIFTTSAQREKFEFEQKIINPPFSKTIPQAYSKPIRGNIPVNIVYELTPQDGTQVSVIEESLKEKGFDQKMEQSDHGTLLAHFDGNVLVNIGHDVDIEIQTIKLEREFTCPC